MLAFRAAGQQHIMHACSDVHSQAGTSTDVWQLAVSGWWLAFGGPLRQLRGASLLYSIEPREASAYHAPRGRDDVSSHHAGTSDRIEASGRGTGAGHGRVLSARASGVGGRTSPGCMGLRDRRYAGYYLWKHYFGNVHFNMFEPLIRSYPAAGVQRSLGAPDDECTSLGARDDE